MKRRSKAGGETIKRRRPKTPEPERRNAPKLQARAKLSPAIGETEVTRLARQLGEERKQRTATLEVLHLLSGSHGDLNHLFDAILSSATTLCQAKFGTLSLCEGDAFRIVAQHNAPPAYAEFRRREPVVRGGPLLRAAETRQLVHIADLREYVASNPTDKDVAAFAKLSGVRTLLVGPMLKDGEVVGAIVIYRQEVCAFNDGEIALVTNFAAQAVIAIENARLLNELRGALERQTATSEVLQVISGSPGDLEPVFAAMLESAVRTCGAKFGNIYRVEGDGLSNVATHNTPTAFAEALRGSPYFSPGPNNPVRRMMQTKTIVHVLDVAASEAYAEREPITVASVELGQTRTLMIVPMLKDNELVGAFTLARQEVRPFTDKQIELVQNFAAQAVIAIENARLLTELRQRTTDLTERTADLTEALEQQTATSEVLQVISSSPSDLLPVFETMLANAVRICDAKFGVIFRWDGDALHLIATYNLPRAFVEARKRLPHHPDHNSLSGRMIASKEAFQVADYAAEQSYAEANPATVAAVDLGGARSTLVVPMLKENDLIGSFTLARQEVRPFTDKQIELVKNFAAQAVIAIENARLLRELRERSDQLAAQSQELAKLNQQLEQRVADQVGEIERMSRLRRFLPPQVADLIVASGSEKQLESHRREITALFCDLRGFTGFTESADAEDVMALLRDYHAAIGEIIIKYNGTLERYAGDGVMVVFNDPVPVENPALQAVLMALEVRDAIGALTEKWRRWGHDLGFGIGIAHGFATLGTIGFEGRFDYAAIGTVSNVASRLCDEAKPGQILISPRVLTKVENAVKVEPFELKGIRRPLAAYNVVAAVN
jgi:GAF domain-containing protein